MASLVGRFRAWVASVEFAVTATSVAVALGAGAVAFETAAADSVDGYFVILLAGVGAPGIYENQWPQEYDRRLLGVAWAVGACLALLTCYVLVATALRSVLDGFAPAAAAFATAWLLGIVAARTVSTDAAV